MLTIAEFNCGPILTQMEAVKSENVPKIKICKCHIEIEEFSTPLEGGNMTSTVCLNIRPHLIPIN